jgi:undecaprenyl diphosphate synthase
MQRNLTTIRPRTTATTRTPARLLYAVALLSLLVHVQLRRTDACLNDLTTRRKMAFQNSPVAYLSTRRKMAFQNSPVAYRSRGQIRAPRIREATTKTILYERRQHDNDEFTRALPNKSRGSSTPRHVAFICDGNSRWAEARFLPASAGHAAGADCFVRCLDTLKRLGVNFCTIYGFSTENWRRPQQEIRDILAIMEHTAKNFYGRASLRENVHVKILGDLEDERIPSSLRDTLKRLERDTAEADASAVEIQLTPIDDSPKLTLCIAVNYGGRQDILNASRKIAEAVSGGELNASDLSEGDFASMLCTSQVPDPDFIIRTGGEQRLSNFLLWNAAYAELYFTDTLWPDFDEASLEEALNWYAKRSRRFGGRQQDNPTIVLNGKSR